MTTPARFQFSLSSLLAVVTLCASPWLLQRPLGLNSSLDSRGWRGPASSSFYWPWPWFRSTPQYHACPNWHRSFSLPFCTVA